MKGTGVRLMLIDDFQHILLGRREAPEVIGLLKEIINSTGVSLVAVATPDIYTLINLQEIIQIKLDLKYLSYQSAEDVAVFKSILDEIEQQHFEFQKPSNIRDFSDEIFILTNGNFAKIFSLIHRAKFLSELNEEPKLSLQSLYYSSREMFGSPKENPLYQRVLEEERKGTLSKMK